MPYHWGYFFNTTEPGILSQTCVDPSFVVKAHLNLPYGGLLRSWSAGLPEKWQSTGHERDWESGWDLRGARMYDAAYGRFLSRDPLGGAFAGWSPYNYVFDRPTSLTDLSGLAPDGGWEDNAQKLAKRTGGEVHEFGRGSARRLVVGYYDVNTHQNLAVVFRRGRAHDYLFAAGQSGYHPRDGMGFVERFGYDLEQWVGGANEFGPSDNALLHLPNQTT